MNPDVGAGHDAYFRKTLPPVRRAFFGHEPMTCPAAYLERGPEALVVGGYRRVVDCAIAGDTAEGKQAADALHRLHREAFGPAESRIILDGLTTFISTLSRCATCPLRAFPSESHHLCRDECLILALVSALQHGDDNAGRLTACALTCPARAVETLAASGDYAMRMKMFGQVLLPVPQNAIAALLTPQPPQNYHQHNHTIH